MVFWLPCLTYPNDCQSDKLIFHTKNRVFLPKISFGRKYAIFVKRIYGLTICQILLPIHTGTHLTDVVTGDVVIIVHHLVDDAIGGELYDAVGHSLYELMVVAAEEDVAFVELQIVVECLDALKVEVVGGGIEDEAVGILELHTGYHTAHFFTS